MVQVLGLDHIALKAQDVDASLAFYVDLLGLECLRLDEFRSGSVPFVSVRVTGDTIIDFFPHDGSVEGQNQDHLCFVIAETDMHALSQRLRDRNIPIVQDVIDRWGARGMEVSLYVSDPDGNMVELRCYKTTQP